MTYLKKNIYLIITIIFLLIGIIYFSFMQKQSTNQTPANNPTSSHPEASPTPNLTPLPELSTSENLLLDLDISQNPSLGDPNAPVVMINYSSYYCGFCSEFKKSVFPQIKEKYIDNGLVYYVYKDVGSSQDNVFLAAHCAGEQDQFWAYQNMLIEKGVQDEADLITYAQALNLNVQLFEQCLAQSDKYSLLIEKARQEMENLNINGIPFFIINNTAFSGLKKVEDIFQIIESQLAQSQNKQVTSI